MQKYRILGLIPKELFYLGQNLFLGMTISSIKDWAEEDRPREKLLLKGKEVLSNAELISIIIGSGSKNESAVALSKRILSSVSSIEELGRKPLEFLMLFKGVGEAKAISITAALELGRRRQISKTRKKDKISSSQDAYNALGPLMIDLSYEEFWIVCLNRANMVLAKEKISAGGVHGTVVDAKIVFGHALRHGASSIILYHNHPSGQVQPSRQDLNLTKKLVEAGKVLDIKVQDHLIIGHDGYFSFIDEGFIT